jgi:hypothetical protein
MISGNNLNLLYKGTSNMIGMINNNKNKKNLILEPLSCLIRISMINFKKEGTKIGISKNSIYFQSPNLFQGALRWSLGDNRNDLHNLHNPIVKSTKWFNSSLPQMKNIFKFAILGLIKLKLAYNENSIISHTFDLYISILETVLENNSKNNKKNDDDINNDNELQKIDGNQNLDNIEEVKNNIIYNSLKNLWSNRELQIINNIILEMDDKKKNGEEIKSYLTCLDNILSEKEEKVLQIVEKASTIL